MYNWDDLKVFLAAYRVGSISLAATELKMSTSTVSRRLQNLEESLGASLFARSSEGLLPTPVAEEIVGLAEATAFSAHQLSEMLTFSHEEPRGIVRLAISDEVEEVILIPALPDLRASYPELIIEVVSGTHPVNMLRREADLALRTMPPEVGDELVVTKLRDEPLAFFAAPELVEQISELAHWSELDWVGWDRDHQHLDMSKLLDALYPDREVAYRSNSLRAIRRAAEAGLGVVLLPRTFGIASPRLMMISHDAHLPSSSLWLVGHRALRRSARISVVWEFLCDLFAPKPLEEEARILRARVAAAYGLKL